MDRFLNMALTTLTGTSTSRGVVDRVAGHDVSDADRLSTTGRSR